MGLGDFTENVELVHLVARLSVDLLRPIAAPEEVSELHPAWLGTLDLRVPAPVVPLTGVWGVGVATDGKTEFPAVLVDIERFADAGTGAGDRRARAALESILGYVPPQTVRYIPISPPEPQRGPGDAITGALAGTLGAAVVSSNGRDGYLTAGHVAPLASVVRDGAGIVGTTTFCQDPAGAATGVLCADVSVLECQSQNQPVGGVNIAGPSSPKAGDVVTVHGSITTNASSPLFLFAPWVAVPSMAGHWADCYLTQAPVSVSGDSGAPVMEQGTDLLVGQIVGGSPGMTSYIQKTDRLLAASQSRLR